MRTWRVGTFSMGLSIISLGCFLLFSVIQGTKVLDSLTAWWPVLLIILGVEILLYLLFSKKEQSFIKYDIFSIFFIGVLGSVGIAFTVYYQLDCQKKFVTLLTQRGKRVIFQMDNLIYLNLSKIVVDAGHQPLTIEGNNTNQIHLLGTYEITTKANENSI